MKKFVISSHGFDMGTGGIKVLHKLCHLLNEKGYDAYIAPIYLPCNWMYTYDKYNTKIVTTEILENLDDCICVYPEYYGGNLLRDSGYNPKNIVRWMLAPPNPNTVASWAPYDSELWFWFIPQYITEYPNKDTDNLLFIFEPHREIFYDKKLPRSGSCYTIRKGELYINEHVENSYEDYKIHPDDSILIPSVGSPSNDMEYLANLFNTTERFYSYDTFTFLSVQSVMCNTDSIVIPAKPGPRSDPYVRSKEQYLSSAPLNRYIAYGIDDLPRARSIRNELSDHIDYIERETSQKVDEFVDKCFTYFR